MKILNRYQEPVEIMFDGRPYKWAPGEERELPDEIALWCRLRSVVKDDPITGRQTRALVIPGIDSAVDPVESRGAELLDRSHMAPRDQVTLVPIANPAQLVPPGEERTAVGKQSRRV